MTETGLTTARGSPNYDRGGGAAPEYATVKARVFGFLEAHPELVRRPTEVAYALSVNPGSAKRLASEWRAKRAPRLDDLLDPIKVQNLRLDGRTNPDTVTSGSPGSPGPLPGFGPWEDRGDHKLTSTCPFPHLEGKVEVVVAGAALEVRLASARAFTPSEALIILALIGPLFDLDAEITLSYEVLRDGASARFEGVNSRNYRSAEGVMLKLYDHYDGRGRLARVEVRPPPVGIPFSEVANFLEGRQPLGRDTKIEELTAMVRDNSEGMVLLKREVRTLAKTLERSLRPLSEGRDG